MTRLRERGAAGRMLECAAPRNRLRVFHIGAGAMSEPHPHRQAALAALLSFVFPGLGQAYVGQRHLAAILALPIVLLVACSVALTVAAGPAFDVVEAAAVQLMEPAGYIEAVLGGGSP